MQPDTKVANTFNVQGDLRLSQGALAPGELPRGGTPTGIAFILELLCEKNDTSEPKADEFDTRGFEIGMKISYNHLQVWKNHVDYYLPLSYQVDEVYQQYDKMGRNKSHRVLRKLTNVYLRKRSEGMEGDVLMDAIYAEVWEEMRCAPNRRQDTYDEDLEFALHEVLVNAFVRCEIFEKPPGSPC